MIKCKHCKKPILKSPDYEVIVWVHRHTDMCRCDMMDDKKMAEPAEVKE